MCVKYWQVFHICIYIVHWMTGILYCQKFALQKLIKHRNDLSELLLHFYRFHTVNNYNQQKIKQD